MNKFLQTTLITAVLSTGAMAMTTENNLTMLPKTIEVEATVYINADTMISQQLLNKDPVTIDNFGTITTECEEGSYPTITGYQTTINNHGGLAAKEESDTDNANKIKENNAIEGVDLGKVCKIIKEEKGTIENVTIGEGIEIVFGSNEIKAEDFAGYTDRDLLYLGAEELGEEADKTVIIRGSEDMETPDTLVCNLGDKESEKSYDIKFLDSVSIEGDISNFKNGSIYTKRDGDSGNTLLYFGNNTKKELYVPITAEDSSVIFTRNADVYSNIDVIDGAIMFGNNTALKSKAVLRLGAKPATTTE